MIMVVEEVYMDELTKVLKFAGVQNALRVRSTEKGE
jgi:hypothetical protein